MRRLLYIPMLHEEADMGSAGAVLGAQTAVLSGEENWAAHRETMGRFWDSVEAYLRSWDAGQLAIYQDGLAADGELGRRIVEEAARRGSRNYRLVLELVRAGARLRKTEDAGLLWEEYQRILGAANRSSTPPGQGTGLELQERRDRFIVEAIATTLREGETGVLFIGAQHELAHRLPGDIRVQMAKDPRKLTSYLEELLLGRRRRNLRSLAEYLEAPVHIE